MKSKLMTTVIFVSMLFSCQLFEDDLTDDFTEVRYSDLPKEVQGVFEQVISQRSAGNMESSDTLVNLMDKKIEFSTNTLDNDAGETFLRRGAYYHFITKEKEFILEANQGDPFVVFENKLYHPSEMALQKEEYLDATYYVYELE